MTETRQKVQIVGVDGTGNIRSILTDASGNMRVDLVAGEKIDVGTVDVNLYLGTLDLVRQLGTVAYIASGTINAITSVSNIGTVTEVSNVTSVDTVDQVTYLASGTINQVDVVGRVDGITGGTVNVTPESGALWDVSDRAGRDVGTVTVGASVLSGDISTIAGDTTSLDTKITKADTDNIQGTVDVLDRAARAVGTVTSTFQTASSMAVGSISVPAASTQIVASNASRKSVVVKNNTSDQILYVGTSPADANAFPLSFGQTFEDKQPGVYTGAVFGYSTATVDSRFIETS